MAFDLNPVAVSSAALLRACHEGGWTDKGELAERGGKVRNNIARDLGTLEKAGLIVQKTDPADPRPIALTDDGLAQLAALDRAANLDGPVPDADRWLRHDQMEPDPDNPRTDIDADEDDLDDLRLSIVSKGVLQNFRVRPMPGEDGRYFVTIGNRRWTAIAQAISDGDWPEDRLIPVEIVDEGEEDRLTTAIVENIQRKGMHPLDEAEAYRKLRDDHGRTTAEIAARTGVELRVIQNRLQLLALDDDARFAMRLPKDDPNRLTYKAALKSLQQPKPADPAPTDESGSPPPPPAKAFGETLSDKEALLIVEVAARLADAPDPDFTEPWTRIVAHPVGGAAHGLVARSVLGFRQRGLDKAFVTLRRLSTDAGRWLNEIGFEEHRADVLFEMRTRVVGHDRAAALAVSGDYATDWLNVDAAPVPEIGGGLLCRPDPTLTQAEIDSAYADSAAALDRIDQRQPEQPDLIAPSPEEEAARRNAARENTAAGLAADVTSRFAHATSEWAGTERAADRQDYLNASINPASGLTFEDMALNTLKALSAGRVLEAGAILASLHLRINTGGAGRLFAELPLPLAAQAMLEARLPQASPDDDDYADPIGDFIDAELDDAEAALDTEEPAIETGGTPGLTPAVSIRKSITPDHIVCLEDGRKFKSLKRHLRTKYDLSPEQYRAKWGLPGDYPMVAPNYARARAELARQMGLGS